MLSSPDPVTSLRVRLERAKKHLDELNAAIERFSADMDSHGFRRERDDREPVYHWRMDLRKLPPPELGLIIADCVNHMRSFLDNLMWELMDKYSSAKIRRRVAGVTKFPICITEDSWVALRPTLSYLPEEVLNRIEMNQPFRAREHGLTPKEHLVWMLNRRWNDDKHRRIESLRFVFEDGKFGPWRITMAATDMRFYVRADHDAIVASIRFPSFLSPEDEKDLYADILCGIGFGPRAMDAHPVARTLAHFHRILSEETLPLFEPFLAPPDSSGQP